MTLLSDKEQIELLAERVAFRVVAKMQSKCPVLRLYEASTTRLWLAIVAGVAAAAAGLWLL